MDDVLFEDDGQPLYSPGAGSSGDPAATIPIAVFPPLHKDFNPAVVDAHVAAVTGQYMRPSGFMQAWERFDSNNIMQTLLDCGQPPKRLRFVPEPAAVAAVVPAQTVLRQQNESVFRAVVSRVRSVDWEVSKEHLRNKALFVWKVIVGKT